MYAYMLAPTISILRTDIKNHSAALVQLEKDDPKRRVVERAWFYSSVARCILRIIQGDDGWIGKPAAVFGKGTFFACFIEKNLDSEVWEKDDDGNIVLQRYDLLDFTNELLRLCYRATQEARFAGKEADLQ